MKCEKCGKELSLINVNVFNYDGTDKFVSHSYNEYYKDAVVIDTTPNWTGYELSEEEIGIRYINENQLPVILKRYENIDVEEYERTATKAQEIVCKLYDIDTQTKILYDFLVDLYLRTRI